MRDLSMVDQSDKVIVRARTIKLRNYILLVTIIVLAAFFRFYGLNWDQGHHLHPDERAIVMFTTPLRFPETIAEFFSPKSPWNPHFFAYGSFPIYLLKLVSNAASSINQHYASYEGINLVGRFLSGLFDIGTLLLLFLLSRKLFNIHVALLATFFYVISVLPIQLSHFYAVDTPLTLFVLLTLFTLINFYEKPSFGRAALVGVFFGLSLATKTSALVLLVSIGIAIVVDFLLIFLKNIHRFHIWLPHVPALLRRLLGEGIVIILTTLITFAIAEPYAFIDFHTFWRQNMEQYQMTHNAYIFPYTLQYVGKLPYFYELKNIFLWGLGPIQAILSFLGAIYFTFLALKKEKKEKWAQEVILATFFWAYFLVIGRFAIGFMRYLLPIYPLLCLFAAVFLYRLMSFRVNLPKADESRNLSQNKLVNMRSLHALRLVGMTGVILAILIWPLSFIHIYTKPNTRVLASQWINQHIPPGSTLAVEHWDDRVPMFGGEKYQFVEMTLYDQPDDGRKWAKLNQKLAQTDYIIIASHRLYVPLQKLADCTRYKSCYPKTAQYYQQLFNGTLGFQRVAELEVYPEVPLFNIPINDQAADESFTVYDHPKVMIFKKILF